ncbi:MAG TPA: hypothetical protein VNR70_04565 [Steroidobacteraceae bacterium]|jgi:hypothetical protein|nr:hypothetical protein [Steroidobacteraceae bacterium]
MSQIGKAKSGIWGLDDVLEGGLRGVPQYSGDEFPLLEGKDP